MGSGRTDTNWGDPEADTQATSHEPRWFSWTRPASYREVLGAHLPPVAVTGTILLISVWLPYRTVSFRLCAFLRLTGLSCPFCGYSRAFAALTSGDWSYALYHCPCSFVLYAAVLLILLWNLAALLLGVRIRRGRHLRWSARTYRVLALALVLLLAANWVYRLQAGLK